MTFEGGHGIRNIKEKRGEERKKIKNGGMKEKMDNGRRSLSFSIYSSINPSVPL